MATIKEIEGIGPAYAEKLKKAGVATTEGLLKTAASKAGRVKLAQESGIDESRILTVVNMADLMRVKGVGGEFAELLKAAGVDTIKELRTRNAENLTAKMEEINKEKKLVRRTPSLKMVTEFVNQAKNIDPAVSH